MPVHSDGEQHGGAALVVADEMTPALVPERLSTLDELAAGWLLRYGPGTRDAYTRDLRGWLTATTARGQRLAPSSRARRLSALASFYRYCVRQRALSESPFFEVARPSVSGASTSTGLSRDELRRLVDVAQADSTRAGALVALLAFNGLRITEALSRDVEHLTFSEGHRVLRLDRKGGKRATAPLAPVVVRALEAYVGDRTSGPIFTTKTGRRLTRTAAYRLLQRLARKAEIPAAAQISPHSARHAFATLALDAGVPLRDVQDAMGHADPRTTRRYDRSRHSLDRHATYAVAAYLSSSTPT
jgi:integrase/recombinase XerD